MNSLICPICQCNFNLTTRKPRVLECGHTYCTECLQEILQKKELKCPVDNKTWSDIVSIDEVKTNFIVMDSLLLIELQCTNHPTVSASYLHNCTLFPLCNECVEAIPRINLIDMEFVEITY